jgi:hypothetical protein
MTPKKAGEGIGFGEEVKRFLKKVLGEGKGGERVKGRGKRKRKREGREGKGREEKRWGSPESTQPTGRRL